MRITSYLENGKLTLELMGEIDHHTAKNFITTIERKIEAYNPHTCVLDFTGVTFMDSSGIAVVIHTFRNMTKLSGKMYVINLQEQPLKVFRASGMDKMIETKEVFN